MRCRVYVARALRPHSRPKACTNLSRAATPSDQSSPPLCGLKGHSNLPLKTPSLPPCFLPYIVERLAGFCYSTPRLIATACLIAFAPHQVINPNQRTFRTARATVVIRKPRTNAPRRMAWWSWRLLYCRRQINRENAKLGARTSINLLGRPSASHVSECRLRNRATKKYHTNTAPRLLTTRV